MSGQATARPWLLKATPWPWGFYPATAYDVVVEEVRGSEGCEYEAQTQIATIHNSAVGGKDNHPSAVESEANAELIVRAVNCHDDLLEALEGLLSFAEDAETKALVGDEGCLWPVEIARAAIARARGEQA